MSTFRQTQFSRFTRRYPVSHEKEISFKNSETMSLTHLKKGRASQKSFDICLEPVVFGRHKSRHINLDNSTIDPAQVSITYLEDELLFIDRGRQNIASFNGRYGRQHIASVDDCTVVKILDDIIIYHGLRQRATDLPTTNVYLWLQAKDGRRYYSEGRPLLVGASPNCEVPLVGEGAPDYSCAIFWTEHGIVLEPLNEKHPIIVNGYRINEGVMVQANDVIEIDENSLTLGYKGDVYTTSKESFPPLLQDGYISLSVIEGPAKGCRAVLDDGNFTAGNGAMDDFPLDDPDITPETFQMVTRGICFSIRKGNGPTEILVNGKEVRSGVVYPGDVLKVGENVIVPHFR